MQNAEVCEKGIQSLIILLKCQLELIIFSCTLKLWHLISEISFYSLYLAGPTFPEGIGSEGSQLRQS